MGSEITRQATKDWFGNSVLTRLNDPATGSIIVVTHRLHEDDLSSLFLEQEGWVHLKLPAIAEADYEYPVSRSEVHTFRRGEVLHPEHLPREEIEERRRILGRAVFQAQYQQDPAPAGSSLSAWQLIRTVSEAPEAFDHVVQSWDLALTKSIEASYSACVTFGIIGPTAFVIDVERFKLEAPDLLTVINKKRDRWNPHSILIETSGAGQAVFQMLKRQKFENLLWTKPTKDKLARLLSIEDMLRAGRLVVVDSKAWFQSYRSEFISFPGGRFDDQVDATTQFMALFDRIVRKTIAIERKRKGENRYNHLIKVSRRPEDRAWSGEDVWVEYHDRYA